MPVVINDFEVEVQPASSDDAAPSHEPPAPPPAASELENILRRQAERCARIYAH